VAAEIMAVLRECAEAIAGSYEDQRGRGYSGERPTQYHLDLAADAAGLAVLLGAKLRVVSEESGVSGSGEITVVMDPIDGSTNCDRGVPFFATSLAALRGDELIAGLVVNLATKTWFEAELGAGATRDGVAIRTSGCETISRALVSYSGLPSRHAGWAQLRTLGAASLECCLVADGSLDLFAVAQHSTLNTWDYLAGLLICREAGAVGADYEGRELVMADSASRRPVFAASEALLAEALAIGPL
jgi:myo-inositol-1(or 4)-monophosphatase